MTKEEIERLKEDWDSVCNRYLKAFCDKHGYLYEDDAWVGSDPGTIAAVADYFIGMNEIRYDLDNNIPEEVFLKWYDYDTMVHELGMPKRINYESWCRGKPRGYTEEDFDKVRKLQEEVRRAKDALEKCIDEINNKDF